MELGCIKPLCDLLTLMDSKIVQVALNGLENILRLGELEAKRGGGINPYCALIEEAYGKGRDTHNLSPRRRCSFPSLFNDKRLNLPYFLD